MATDRRCETRCVWGKENRKTFNARNHGKYQKWARRMEHSEVFFDDSFRLCNGLKSFVFVDFTRIVPNTLCTKSFEMLKASRSIGRFDCVFRSFYFSAKRAEIKREIFS
jgi:hypothetical protein